MITNSATEIKIQTREHYLDVLKGIAMLGVLFVHYFPSGNHDLDVIQNMGSRCPQLFFIVSAFLTWKVLDNVVDYKLFYKKRFIRIAPLYYISLLFALLLPTVTIYTHSLLDYIAHITFLNGLIPFWSNNIMHVEWYIADLSLLYFLTPFLKKIAYDMRSSVIALLISTLISSISLILCNHLFSEQMALYPSWEMFLHTFFILNQLPIWLMGVVFFYVVKDCKKVTWGGGGISCTNINNYGNFSI